MAKNKHKNQRTRFLRKQKKFPKNIYSKKKSSEHGSAPAVMSACHHANVIYFLFLWKIKLGNTLEILKYNAAAI
jgi:hypothetical protein